MTIQQDFDALHAISPGKHFYQFYKSEDDFLSVMLPYFASGLQKGNACLWLVSQKHQIDLDKIITEMNQRYHPSKKQFRILFAEDWYLDDNGDFNEEKSLRNAENYIKEVLNLGFKTIRGSEDGGAIQRKDWPLVHTYEGKADCMIKSNPLIALCAYPIHQCTPSQTKQVLEVHDDVLVGKW